MKNSTIAMITTIAVVMSRMQGMKIETKIKTNPIQPERVIKDLKDMKDAMTTKNCNNNQC